MKRNRKAPKIIAHRGYSGKYPENTMLAFQKAITEGNSDGIELDVQLSKDGEVVVFHDKTLERLTGNPAEVSDLTAEELAEQDVGIHFSKEFAGEGIPSLREVLEYAKTQGFLLNIELKVYHKEDREPLVERTILLVREYGLEDQVLLSSFDLFLLILCRKKAPDIKTAFLHHKPFKRAVHTAKLYGIQAINPSHFCVRYNPLYAHHCRKNGLEVNAWTVNRPHNMLKMIEKGVDSIITNHPYTLSKIILGKEKARAKRKKHIQSTQGGNTIVTR